MDTLTPGADVQLPRAPGSGAGQQRTLLAVRALTCVSATAEGYDIGMISGVLVLMKVSLGLGAAGSSIFIGVFGFACALGALLGGRIADTLGRKRGLAATYVLLVIGSGLLAMANGIVLAVAGRVFHGAGVGAGFVCVGLYLTELAPAHHRGMIVGLEALFLNVGMLAGAGGNWLLLGSTGSDDSDWRLMVLLSAAVPLGCAVALGISGLLPESPRWLHMQGRTDEALEALHCVCSLREVEKVQQQWRVMEASSVASWREVLGPVQPRKRRALISGVGVAVLQMLSGLTAVVYYSSYILSKEMGRREAFTGSLVMLVAKLLVLVVAIFLVDTVGRKPLLLASTALMSAAMAFLGWCYLVHTSAWMKVVALSACTASFSVGLGCVVYIYVSEVFGSRERAKGSALAFFASRTVNGAVTAAFPWMEASLGMGRTWLAFAVTLLFGAAFIAFFVEETSCQSLEDLDAPAYAPPAARNATRATD